MEKFSRQQSKEYSEEEEQEFEKLDQQKLQQQQSYLASLQEENEDDSFTIPFNTNKVVKIKEENDNEKPRISKLIVSHENFDMNYYNSK